MDIVKVFGTNVKHYRQALGIERCAVIVGYAVGSYKIVSNPTLLLLRRGCSAYRYFRKYLPRISINYWYAVILGNI